jgi:hypothetical protein
MSADWRRLSRVARLSVNDSTIDVRFADGRGQAVYVDERAAGGLRLWSVAASASIVRRLADAHTYTWRRNRVTELVGFRVEPSGRIVGEVFVPDSGLTPEEWELYVLTVARASDRFEYLLSGDDVH